MFSDCCHNSNTILYADIGKRKRIPVPEGGVILGGAEENATVRAVVAALFANPQQHAHRRDEGECEAYSEVTFQSLDH